MTLSPLGSAQQIFLLLLALHGGLPVSHGRDGLKKERSRQEECEDGGARRLDGERRGGRLVPTHVEVAFPTDFPMLPRARGEHILHALTPPALLAVGGRRERPNEQQDATKRQPLQHLSCVWVVCGNRFVQRCALRP